MRLEILGLSLISKNFIDSIYFIDAIDFIEAPQKNDADVFQIQSTDYSWTLVTETQLWPSCY